jgi:drug/metabolite transporter (DMT)-like permease
MRSSGMLLCIASAAAFGAMAVFGKLALADGATVGTLLAGRFALAAALFWVFLAVRGHASEVRALGRRDTALALALGAFGYAGPAAGYFVALERIDASLAVMLVYTFPAIVAIAAVALGRERLDARRATALGLASGGLALVLAGAGAGTVDPLGVALALGTAVVYGAYVLAGDGVSRRADPRVLAALVCSGAAASLNAGSLLLGQLRPEALTPAGWGWMACLAVVSTVAALGLFFAGLRRVGPTTASLLATVEPLVTVLLAFLVFGERLGALQLAGGALVAAAVVALRTPAVRPAVRVSLVRPRRRAAPSRLLP